MAKNNNNAAVKGEQRNSGKGEAPKKKRGIGRWFKETFSELKKVTWPTFMTVLKQTGVVLLVTVLFLVVLFGMDRLLSWLYDLLRSGLVLPSSPEAVLQAFKSVPIIGGMLL